MYSRCRFWPFQVHWWRESGSGCLPLVCDRGPSLSPPALETVTLWDNWRLQLRNRIIQYIYNNLPQILKQPLELATYFKYDAWQLPLRRHNIYIHIEVPFSVSMFRQRVTRVSAPFGQVSTNSSSSGEFIPIPRICGEANDERCVSDVYEWAQSRTVYSQNS